MVKVSAYNEGDLGLIPGLGRSPGEMKGYTFQCSGLENCSPRCGRVGSDWATFTFPWFLNGAGSWLWSWSCLLWVSWRPPEWCRLHKAPVLAYVEIQSAENKHQMEGFRGRVPFTTQHTLPYTHTYILIPMCVCLNNEEPEIQLFVGINTVSCSQIGHGQLLSWTEFHWSSFCSKYFLLTRIHVLYLLGFQPG